MGEQQFPDVGAQLRTLRQLRSLSVRSLAELCDLSPNTISLIERGVTSPSVATLHRLAIALRVPITAFFKDRQERVELILSRAQERPRSGSAGTEMESLGSGLEGQALEPFVVTLKPGAGSGRQSMVHAGHELVYCLQGQVEYEVSERPYLLASGDALIFEARLPHRWRNPYGEPAVFLLIFQAVAERVSVEQHMRP